MWPFKRRPTDDATTADRLLDMERRLADMQEQLDFDKDRFERQRGQILTLSRRFTKLDRRVYLALETEPLEDGEDVDYDRDYDEFPEEDYEALKRQKGQKDG